MAKERKTKAKKAKSEAVESAPSVVADVFYQNKSKEARAREIVRLSGSNTTFSGNNSDQNAYQKAKATGKDGEELVLEVYKVLGGMFAE